MPTAEFYNNEENAKTGKCINCGNTNILVWPVNYNEEDEVHFATQLYCKECCVKYTQSCEICDEVFAFDRFYNINHTKYCGSCMRERFVRCYYCHTFIHKSENNYVTLPDRIQRESLNSDYNWVICNNCYHNGRWLIHDYSFEPPFTFYKTEKDKKTNLYYGIELEVEAPQNKTDIILGLPDFIYVKADSSIEDGFELVTHPMTYNWLITNKNEWYNILNLLVKYNCKSETTQTCGMHIHMSLAAFGSYHLTKFMEFINSNKEFTKFISQRDIRRLSQWAKLDNKKSVRIKARDRREYNDRHSAVTIARDTTAEVRIFQGTLILDEFYKNIQFCDAVYNFTQNISVNDLSISNFQHYINCTQNKYSYLYKFMKNDKVNIML